MNDVHLDRIFLFDLIPALIHSNTTLPLLVRSLNLPLSSLPDSISSCRFDVMTINSRWPLAERKILINSGPLEMTRRVPRRARCICVSVALFSSLSINVISEEFVTICDGNVTSRLLFTAVLKSLIKIKGGTDAGGAGKKIPVHQQLSQPKFLQIIRCSVEKMAAWSLHRFQFLSSDHYRWDSILRQEKLCPRKTPIRPGISANASVSRYNGQTQTIMGTAMMVSSTSSGRPSRQ